MNVLGCPLNLVDWQESQVSALAKALVGTVNTASLNSAAVQGGHVVFQSKFLYLISLVVFLAYFKGEMLGYNLVLF